LIIGEDECHGHPKTCDWIAGHGAREDASLTGAWFVERLWLENGPEVSAPGCADAPHFAEPDRKEGCNASRQDR
jgi:hypothetical protein